MKSFQELFETSPVILPVIHVESADQALRNAQIAREAECNGLFLINHNSPYVNLLNIHRQVYLEHPDWWIGVNFLDLAAWEVFEKLSDEIAGVWVDNAHIDESSDKQEDAERIAVARKDSGWQGLYFGGVAFKGQRAVEDFEGAVRLASQHMDVVTTSGAGTGIASDVGKIQRMRSAIGTHPLAIASGITPENIHEYSGYADCYLVSTGISSSWTELNPLRVKELMSTVR